MKILVLLIVYILTLPLQIRECKNIKNGKFSTENPDGSVTIITWKGNKQIENLNNGERISEFEVKWKSECEYLLFNRRVIKGIDPWLGINGDTLRIKVVKILSDSYLTEGEMLSIGRKMNQQIKILKNWKEKLQTEYEI